MTDPSNPHVLAYTFDDHGNKVPIIIQLADAELDWIRGLHAEQENQNNDGDIAPGICD